MIIIFFIPFIKYQHSFVHHIFIVRFQDKLSINVSDSQIQTVSLMAYGSGTTIVSEPPLAPAVKLGPQFSCQPVKRWFRLTNSGRRPQQIYWTTEGFLPYRTKKKTEYNPDDMRFQVITQIGHCTVSTLQFLNLTVCPPQGCCTQHMCHIQS